MNKLPKFLLLLMLLLSNNSPLIASDNEGGISLEQASEMVRLKSKGRILSARTDINKGKQTHRIQVLTPTGRVKIFQISSSNKSHRPDNRSHNGTFTSFTRSKHSSGSNRRGRHMSTTPHSTSLGGGHMTTSRHSTISERNRTSISNRVNINVNNSNQERVDQR